MSSELKYSLMENSYSFLKHSLSQAIQAEKEPEYWKFALLHLVQAIELVLKELLRKEHPILIYKSIDNPNETVSLKFAASRLQKISKIKFNPEDLNIIEIASNYRNQIVHYSFSFKVAELKSIYAKLIGFLQSFMVKHFKVSLDAIVESDNWDEALFIIEYAKELEKRAEERIKEEGIHEDLIMECSRCYNFTFVFQDEIDTCYACGYKDEVHQCDGCEEFFYVDDLMGRHEFDDNYFCSECREDYDDGSDYWEYMDSQNYSP